MRAMLVLDNPMRDLPGLVLVAAELALHGVEACITPRGRYVYELPYIQPDFLLLNYFRRKCPKTVRPLLKYGFALGVLDTEGGIRTNMEELHQTEVDDVELRAKVEGFFCWGEATAEWLISNGFYTKQQVCVSGNPRFDFYVGNYAKAALELAPDSLKQIPSPRVLCNGIFASANSGFATPEENIQSLVKVYHYDEKTTREWFAKDLRAMLEFVRIVKTLAEERQDIQFIYRPHPFERMESYHEHFQDVPNIHLLREGSVTPWILASMAVIHPNCTTGVEARFAGLDSLLPVWLETSNHSPSVTQISTACHSVEDILRCLATATSRENLRMNPEMNRHFEKIVRDWFSPIDGRAHQRLAHFILDRLKQRKSDRAKAEPPPLTGPVATAKYDTGGKYFSVGDVQGVVEALTRCECLPQQRISVAWAEDAGLYSHGFHPGRSVALLPR